MESHVVLDGLPKEDFCDAFWNVENAVGSLRMFPRGLRDYSEGDGTQIQTTYEIHLMMYFHVAWSGNFLISPHTHRYMLVYLYIHMSVYADTNIQTYKHRTYEWSNFTLIRKVIPKRYSLHIFS